jgi:YD repeat-containing protein
LRLTNFPDAQAERAPPSHVILRIDAPGFLTAFRDAWLRTGTAEDLGTIRLVAADPQVTVIGPEGGTASDSRGLFEVQVPAGALASPVPIQITAILARDDFPAPLPDSTPTLYGVVLSPTGTTFSSPVTVRIANRLGISTSLSIPTGFYDETTGRWEHVGQATWDGTRFAFQTTHFTEYDGNFNKPPDTKPGKKPPTPTNPPPKCDSSVQCCPPDPSDPAAGKASDATMTGGSLRQTFRLPSYRVRSEDFSLALSYDSGLAGSRELGVAGSDYAAVAHAPFSVSLDPLRLEAIATPRASDRSVPTLQPGVCPGTPGVLQTAFGQATPIPFVVEQAVAGATFSDTVMLGAKNKEAETGAFLHLPLVGAEVPGSGLYVARTVVRAQSPGACITSGGTFGVSTDTATPVQTNLEPGPLATFDRHVLVNHRVSSPFGAGWAVRELSRVYRAGDVAFLAGGDGGTEYFRPRAYLRTVTHFPPFAAVAAQDITRDPVTGEIFLAREDSTLGTIDPTSGNFTTLLSGLPFSNGPAGFAVGYVSGSRRFLVWVDTQLFEIDGGGGTSVLKTRGASTVFQTANVAARGDLVVFTDSLTPAIYALHLSDPSRTITTLSSLSGGDVRLFPKSPLSGVTFADPRGLAFAADGTLYVADVKRNEVYAIAPEPSGEIGPTSVVDAVIGDGTSSHLPPLGERYPGIKLTMSEPLGLSIADDGTVVVATSYGAATYDPVAREGEWLLYSTGIDETVAATGNFIGIVALSKSSLLTRFPGNILRYDVDLLSSEREPTRTLSRLSGGGLELLDTTAATIEHFDVSGRLVEKRKRTGEIVFSVTYSDAQGDRVDRITDAADGDNVFSYDGAGKLQSITDARGRMTTVSVDGLGDLVSMRKPDLETWGFTYAEHHMTAKTSPKEDTTRYTFRADGTVATLTKPEGAQTTIDAALSHPATYDGTTGALVRGATYTDQRGVVHAYQVNARGEVDSDTYTTADGVGRTDQAVYVGASTSVVSDASGFSQFIGDYTADGQLDGNTQRLNRLFRVAYRVENGMPLSAPVTQLDAHYRPLLQPVLSVAHNINSSVHEWRYAPDGWLRAERVGGAANAQVFERDTAGHVLRVFDSDGNIVSSAPPPVAGQITTYTYRPDGQIATSTLTGDGTRNYVKMFSYDDAGGTLNDLGWTDSLGRSMALTLDAAGNVTQTFDGTATTHATFDAMNRLVTSSDALGNTTTYGYAFASCGCSQENLVTSIHTPDLPAGVDWLMNYDGQGRLASVTDPQGFTESYQYEPTSELKTLTDKLSRATRYTHDDLGRVSSMIDTLGRSHGNTYAFPQTDATSQPVWVGPSLMAGSGDTSAAATSLTAPMRNGDYQIGKNGYAQQGYPAIVSLYRDATFELGLSRHVDQNRRQTDRFDRVGQPIDSVANIPASASGGFWRQLDSWNVRTALSAPSGTTSLDATGSNADSASYTQNIFFELVQDDGFGQGAGNQEADVATTYARDDGGRVTAMHRRFNGAAGIGFIADVPSTYTYRPDGRLGRLVNPDGTHDFTYDSRGLVETQVVSGEGTYSFGYDEMSRNNLLTFPDGHTRRQQFDELGRLTSRCYDYTPLGGAVRCYGASYDAVGNPVRMTDPDGVDVLEYDALDRLTKVTRFQPDGVTVVSVEDYAFNALGALKLNAGVALDDQRPRRDGGGTADAAVPATLGGQPVTLNAGGFVTSLRGSSFSFTTRGILREAQDPIPAALEHYGYDAALRRISKQQSGDVEFYVYEGMDRVAILDGAGAPKETYLFDGIDHPLRITQTATGTTAYYELDLEGNVRALRASGGSDLGGYRYTAFGKTVEDTTTINQALRWKARWFSSVASGIYDVRARQWAPELGVFLAIDEFGYHDVRSTLWGWPHQSPRRFSDFLGNQTVTGLPNRTECLLLTELPIFLCWAYCITSTTLAAPCTLGFGALGLILYFKCTSEDAAACPVKN